MTLFIIISFILIIIFVIFIMPAINSSREIDNEREDFCQAVLDEGYKDISSDSENKKKLISYIGELYHRFYGNINKSEISRFFIKKKENKDFYLFRINLYKETGKLKTPLPDTGETVLFVILPAEVKNSYFIAQKAALMNKEQKNINFLEKNIKPVPGLDRGFEGKFLAFSLESIKNENIITPKIQDYILKYYGKPPFPANSMGRINIWKNYLVISGKEVQYPHNLKTFIKFGEGLAEFF